MERAVVWVNTGAGYRRLNDDIQQDDAENNDKSVVVWADTKVGYSHLEESDSDDSQQDGVEEEEKRDEETGDGRYTDGDDDLDDDNENSVGMSFWEQGYSRGAGHGKIM